MRLTLRTLLAYLDDILAPAQAKEIGEKINESSFAASTVERIKDVLRRRRNTAPDVIGPNAPPDPNLVAEYLDNPLAQDVVEELERLCLESDVHLAEVAACHQVLTLVLGEPVDIPADTRDRMYALGAVSDAGSETTESVPPAQPRPAPARNPETPSTTPSGLDSSEAAIPDYLRRRSTGRRILPVVVLLLIAAAWLATIVTDQTLLELLPIRFDQQQAVTATEPDAGAEAVEPAGDQEAAGEEAAPEQPAEPPAEVARTPEAGSGKPGPIAIANIDPPPPADMPDPEVSPVVPMPEPSSETPRAEMTPGNGTTVDEPADAPPQIAKVTPETVPPPEPAPETPEPVAPPAPVHPMTRLVYVDQDGILLAYDAERGGWMASPGESVIHAGARIASPEPFNSRLIVESGDADLTVFGGTVGVWNRPSKPGWAHLALDRGRVALHVHNLPDAPGEPELGVRAGGTDYTLRVLEPGTVVGLEVTRRQPSGRPAAWTPGLVDGGVFVIAGAVRITDPEGNETTVRPELGWWPWPGSLPVTEPQPLRAIPEWLTDASGSTTERRLGMLFEREFILEQPVSQFLPTVVKDPRPYIAELAVKALAVTDDYRALLRALQSDHEESRLAAIVALREWLPQDPRNGELLVTELNRTFRDDDVTALEQLLWGYSAEDARDPEISRQLVAWLSHDDIAIRELAFYQIYRLTGRRYDYRSFAPPVQRQAAVVRWEEHLRREGALIGE
ncbi:MAG: HEAT repeat domain-containing protein [Maioricimonas sp. JB045]